jgi:hypothetical protein
VLIKSDAIAGQVECKRVVKWSAISQLAHSEKQPLAGVQARHPVLPPHHRTSGLSRNIRRHEPKDCHSTGKVFSLIHGLKDG